MLAWRRGNVTALRTRGEIVRTLFGDALALLDVPQLRARSGAGWLDLGAGAGVPGIPLAVALPTAELTLLDSAVKKCAFLDAAVEAAGLRARATVVCARSENLAAIGQPGREAYAVVLARAVAPLPALVELAAPLLAPGGVLLASKTAKAVREEGPGGAAVAKLCGLAAGPVIPLPRSPLDDGVCAVFEKVAATPKRLPRREGQAARHPLSR
jgi:16S rRNA (guanine527-N7)-methyltransferase